MKTFHFDKDAEILIYGYGKVGRNLHRKLLEQGYHVVGIIDRNAEQFAPIDNCASLRPEELDTESTDHIIVLTLQNILEHERVVKLLLTKGMKKIVFLNRSDPKTYDKWFKAYNELVYDEIISNFEFPYATIEIDSECRSYYREESESIIVEVPVSLLFTTMESPPWQNINITAFKEYNALYDVLLSGKYDFPKDIESYCDILCGPSRSMEDYLQDRFLLYKMMQAEYMNHGISFFRNAPPTAQWNREKRYFNLIDGHHRASFLFNIHVNAIPIRISREDYEEWYNEAAVESCRTYMEQHRIKCTYTPICHPFFYDIDYSAEKGGSLSASALYKFFREKTVTDMSVLDVNANLSYFAQIFARMGTTKITSLEQKKEFFELATLLNKLHYISTIVMYNKTIDELDVQDSYAVVIMANDEVPDLYAENKGKQLLKKIDSLSAMYFIKRSHVDHDEERQFVLANSSFRAYRRLNVEIIDGKLSEVGVYEK